MGLKQSAGDNALDEALELLLDPITGSPAHGREVVGILLIHVDDSFFTGTPEFLSYLVHEIWERVRKLDQKIGTTLCFADNEQNGYTTKEDTTVT